MELPRKKGLCCLPNDSEQISDADEEVFLLYTELQAHQPSSSSGDHRGLGQVDSHQDILTVNFTLTKPAESTSPARSFKRKGRRSHDAEILDLEIQIAQDKTSLRTRKGDTGSVVWKASVDFASMILQDARFGSNTLPSLFDSSELKNAHVLELGSGTGILSVALSSLVRRYTSTDIDDIVPLIQKNLVLNFPQWPHESNVSLAALDWIELQKTSISNRSRLFKFDPVDLLLVVDCIYHPYLIPPLVETIDYLTTPDVTTVLVVVELRAEDVIREFLSCWLGLSFWEIWRIGSGEEQIMRRPYAMWVGIKHISETC
ncbi:putative methyltransferase-domain-containing protein [Rhodocollybia butyracea]|uniref:Methyltransferase-domain-containing protein n=1 Tax=Rhodocollybia butyracea TaxID=206335 RepID=A0A9P5QAD4_9AGAR|nr:putative methyltransferase-domain-containing protein [Rhodocollybia butyracea]